MSGDGNTREGRIILGGAVEGPLLLSKPIAFWGGFDPVAGRISEQRHEQFGEVVTGKIVAMPGLRGPTSSGSPLAESLRLRTGPRALLLVDVSLIAVMAGMIADRLYGSGMTVVAISNETLAALADWKIVAVAESGRLKRLS